MKIVKPSIRLIHIGMLIIELLGTTLFLLWCWFNVSGYLDYGINYLKISPITFLTVLPIFPLILSLFMLYVTICAFKGKDFFFRKWLQKKKVLFPLYSLYTMIALAPIFLFIGALFNESPPYLFPLDDPQATYTITKHDDLYWIKYDTTSDLNKSWTCGMGPGYKGCREEITRNIESFVASSKVDLEPFINKHSKITGDFVNATKQCIANKCEDLGRVVGLDILSIQLVSSENLVYTNKQANYSIEYPSDWGYRDVPINLFDQEDRITLISYTAFSPVYKDRPDFGNNMLETPHGDPLLVVRKAEGKKLQQIVDEYEKHLTSYDVKPKIKRKEQRKIAGVEAVLIVQDTEFADPKPSYFTYFFVKNNKIYSYEYQSSNEEPVKIPEQILSSFKFIN